MERTPFPEAANDSRRLRLASARGPAPTDTAPVGRRQPSLRLVERAPVDLFEPFADPDEAVYDWMRESRKRWQRRVAWFAYVVAVFAACYFAFQLGRGAL
jgi:hypothetical protein